MLEKENQYFVRKEMKIFFHFGWVVREKEIHWPGFEMQAPQVLAILHTFGSHLATFKRAKITQTLKNCLKPPWVQHVVGIFTFLAAPQKFAELFWLCRTYYQMSLCLIFW